MVMPFAEEDIYAYYFLYATWVDCVAYLGAVLFLLPCQHIFGGFWRKLRLHVVLKALIFRQNPLKIHWHCN